MNSSAKTPTNTRRKRALAAWVLVAFAIAGALNWSGWLLLPGQDRDRMLLNAVRADNLLRFELLLQAGANPNRVFGTKPEDWVMCEAAERGRLAFMKAAQAHGGDIHMRNTTPPIQVSLNAIFSAPLLCAISMHNHETFSYLLQQGVDTTIPVFTGNKPGQPGSNPTLVGRDMRSTPVMETIGGYKFRMAYDMMKLRPLSWDEKWKLAFFLSDPGGIDTNSEAYRVWLPKILEIARQQGLDEIDPYEPSPEAKRLGIPRWAFAPPPRK